MTVSIINNLLTRVISLRHAFLSGWASLVMKLEVPILVLIVIISIIGLLIFINHNIPYSDLENGKVSKDELQYHRKMQVKAAMICGIAAILLGILGTACVKTGNV